MRRSAISLSCTVLVLLVLARAASAQTIGTFSWQLQPLCNTLTLTVTQVGGVYRLDGFDGQCSAGRRAPASGIATLNPNGTVGLGITIVSTQGGQAVHVDAVISVAALGGSWTDSHGNAGTFVPGGVGDGPNIRPIGASVVTKAVTEPKFIGRRSNGITPGVLEAVPNNSTLVLFEADGYDGAQYSPGALIRATTTQSWTPAAHGARLQFWTTPNDGIGTTPRITIDQDGEVGIGTTDPVTKLDVMGNIRMGTDTTGCIQDRDGSHFLGVCSSDARFKRDIASFEPMLGRVAALRPVHYFWRADEFPAKAFGTRQSYGLVAQEVEQVLPELVTTDADGYRAVNYSKLPLMAVQAIKELKIENDALKAQNTLILERLAALEARIASSTNPR
jgi:hypothetical protein